ncbi:MAG: hypothetical protein KJ600_02955 [Nanoarchaeota archaeon]|nr:hypothetical protein [Nanoarchaeota archaeon]MBU1103488.1 hypothetical protein [Nanoarchaeota archaeon]
MVNQVTQPGWWTKEEEGDSALSSMILGGIFGMLIGIILRVGWTGNLYVANPCKE